MAKRYSDEFKQKCIDAVKSGKYKSIREVARLFDVPNHISISNWLNPEKAKEYAKKSYKRYKEKYRLRRKEYDKKWFMKNREHIKSQKAEYYRCHKQERVIIASKYRGMKSIILFDNPFPDDIPVCYHHLHYAHPYFTIPIPEKIHRKGACNHEKHFDYNRKWIEKLYSMDIYKLLHLNKHHWETIRFDGVKEPSKYHFVAQRFDV